MVAPEALFFSHEPQPQFERPKLTVIEPPVTIPENVVFIADWKKKEQPLKDIPPVLIYGIGTEAEMMAVSGLGSEKDRKDVLNMVDAAWAVVFADDAAREVRLTQDKLQKEEYPLTQTENKSI